MDAQKYYEFVGRAAMEGSDDEDGEPMPEAMRTAVRDAVVASGEMYERMAANVYLTERGIEVQSRVTLSD
jgi:hypothetical protein